MKGYQQGGSGERMGEKVLEIRSTNGRHKIGEGQRTYTYDP